jgi:hypothetical protein
MDLYTCYIWYTCLIACLYASLHTEKYIKMWHSQLMHIFQEGGFFLNWRFSVVYEMKNTQMNNTACIVLKFKTNRQNCTGICHMSKENNTKAMLNKNVEIQKV